MSRSRRRSALIVLLACVVASLSFGLATVVASADDTPQPSPSPSPSACPAGGPIGSCAGRVRRLATRCLAGLVDPQRCLALGLPTEDFTQPADSSNTVAQVVAQPSTTAASAPAPAPRPLPTPRAPQNTPTASAARFSLPLTASAANVSARTTDAAGQPIPPTFGPPLPKPPQQLAQTGWPYGEGLFGLALFALGIIFAWEQIKATAGATRACARRRLLAWRLRDWLRWMGA